MPRGLHGFFFTFDLTGTVYHLAGGSANGPIGVLAVISPFLANGRKDWERILAIWGEQIVLHAVEFLLIGVGIHDLLLEQGLAT